jgi:putative restriction endonuclease
VQKIRDEEAADAVVVDLDNQAERELAQRADIPETMKQQLVMARRGQGLFRAQLEQIEKGCRLTGITQRQHLRASHAKPWRLSTDPEKLDGYNGLLLAPHIDHLFDRGYLAFAESGDVLYSPRLNDEVRERWGLPPTQNVGPFSEKQKPYLAFHREHVFLK